MKPESLVQLIGSGNFKTVEETWMHLLDAPESTCEQLRHYDVVLRELGRTGQSSRAAALAWAAIETLSERFAPQDLLKFAAPFLLAVDDSKELREQVATLYQSAYADLDELSTLLDEAGLRGGRPVRRALRTLDVCLALEEGQFLAARDDGGAARVDRIDRGSWRITVIGSDGPETLGAVHLADRFRPAEATEFHVMRQFAPDALLERLRNDPAPVVIELCRLHGGKLDSDALEALLVPDVLPDEEWKKWWTKARSALRRCANVKIDGRSPYYLTYVDTPVAWEDSFLQEFRRVRKPVLQLAAVEKYLRDCKVRGQAPQEDALRQCYEHFAQRARQIAGKDAAEEGRLWLMAGRVADVASLPEGLSDVVGFFQSTDDLRASFDEIDDAGLLALACDCVVEAHPDHWQEILLDLLPSFPQSLCDKTATRLLEAGRGREDFDHVVEEIIAAPARHFEALLWLWSGPSHPSSVAVPGLVALLSRMMRGLEDARYGEKVSPEVAKRIGTRARTVLSARQYERFDQCLEEMEPEMAIAMYNRIHQLDNLGRTVRGNLLSRLRRRFPPTQAAPDVPPWARDDVLYVTATGLAKKQDDIEHHVNVKMKENAVAIGHAAERGDLSENSEYKFALEERDLLQARLAQMNSEVAMARVLTADMVATDHVGIGTRVRFRRVDDDQPYDLTLLGPWEADADRRRLNYRTPLAQRVLGKHTGDRIEFTHTGAKGTYEIVAIENALLDENPRDP